MHGATDLLSFQGFYHKISRLPNGKCYCFGVLSIVEANIIPIFNLGLLNISLLFYIRSCIRYQGLRQHPILKIKTIKTTLTCFSILQTMNSIHQYTYWLLLLIYNNRFEMQEHAQMMAILKQTSIVPPRLDECLCDIHLLPKKQVCLVPQCHHYLVMQCQQCFSHKHVHKPTNVQKLGAILTKWLEQQWSKIREDSIKIEKQWKTCEANIEYCIDILKQMKETINNRKIKQFPVLTNLIQRIKQVISGKFTVDSILNTVEKLNDEYGLLIGGKIDSHCLDQQRKFVRNKWMPLGDHVRNYSQEALIFSKQLEQKIQATFTYQKKNKKDRKQGQGKTVTVGEIIQDYNYKIMENYNFKSISHLKVEIQNKSDAQHIPKILKQCSNLTALTVDNSNNKLTPHALESITNRIKSNPINDKQYIKQLKLTLNNSDLINITKGIDVQQSYRYIRGTQNLYLRVTDQPKADMKLAAEFCNKFRFRIIYLAYMRSNITKNNLKQFIDSLLDYEPYPNLHEDSKYVYRALKQLNINIFKNKISEGDRCLCHQMFQERYKKIQNKKLLL